MPSAIQAVFGATSQPFQAELRRMEMMAAASGRRITANMGSDMASHANASAIRETAVLGREALRHNWSRMLGSASILVGYLGNIAARTATAVLPTQLLAEAYEKAALKSAVAAQAAIRKAQASEAAFYADAEESDATLASAIADREKAVSAQTVAIATQQKAAAAADAAAAEAAETESTVAGIGVMGIFAGVIAGVAATLLLAKTRLDMLADRLAGLQLDKTFDPKPIARQNMAINEAAEAQKKINTEIQDTIDKYNSAGAAAERFGNEIKTHYAHLRKIQDLRKEAELAGATSPAQKEAIQKRYDDLALQTLQDQQTEEMANLYREKANLEGQGNSAKARADAIKVSSAEEDENRLQGKQQLAEVARKFLEKSEADQNNPSTWDTLKNQFAAGFTPGARAAMESSKNMTKAQAHEWITQYNQQFQKNADNKELREKQDKLNKQAGESLSKAAEIGLSVQDKKKENAQAIADMQEENAAEEALEKARAEKTHGSGRGFELNATERVGSYAATPPSWGRLIDDVKQIAHNTSSLKPGTGKPVGSRSAKVGAGIGR